MMHTVKRALCQAVRMLMNTNLCTVQIMSYCLWLYFHSLNTFYEQSQDSVMELSVFTVFKIHTATGRICLCI